MVRVPRRLFAVCCLLFAGPVYQGAVELDEVEVDREAIRSQADAVAPSERISPWWWLLPPVAYVKTTRIQNAGRQQVMASLTPEQRVQFLTYSNKATGCFIVGGGAALIGIQQAAELVETLHWPGLVTIPFAAAAAAAALAYTVRRMHLTRCICQGWMFSRSASRLGFTGFQSSASRV
jgi:hypothetical protein